VNRTDLRSPGPPAARKVSAWIKGGILLLSLFALQVFLFGCAALHPYPSGKPFSRELIQSVITRSRVQQDLVSSFYCAGKVFFKDGLLKGESEALVVGTRDPFRIKIELTHSWGKPLLHILLDEDHLAILSFRDRKFYEGPFSPTAFSRFLPGGKIDQNTIWGVMRGYPILPVPGKAVSSRGGRILFLDEKGEVTQIAEQIGDGLAPGRIRLPRQGINVTFQDYQSKGEVRFARAVRIDCPGDDRALIFRREKGVFNKTIPEGIFRLEPPPFFQHEPLEEAR